MLAKKCEFCSLEFDAWRSGVKFCSDSCKMKAYQEEQVFNRNVTDETEIRYTIPYVEASALCPGAPHLGVGKDCYKHSKFEIVN